MSESEPESTTSSFIKAPQCEATMENFYSLVIDDVIEKSQAIFIAERTEKAALLELHQTWLSKVTASIQIAKTNAARLNAMRTTQIAPITLPAARCSQCMAATRAAAAAAIPRTNISKPSSVRNAAPLPHTTIIPAEEIKQIVPMNIKLLGHPPIEVKIRVSPQEYTGKRVRMVMSFELLEKLNELVNVTSERAAEIVQGMVDAQERDATAMKVWELKPLVSQNDGLSDENSDTSEDKDEDHVSTDDDSDMDFFEEGIRERDPDSADDITEEEDEFEDTDNLILCTYSQIKRHKTHWKFRFDKGIMIIDGVEYIFNKAVGESIW